MLELLLSFGLIVLVVYFLELSDQILPPSTEVLLYVPDTEEEDNETDDSLEVQRSESDSSDFNLDDFSDLLNEKYDEGLDITEEDAQAMLNKIYEGGSSKAND